MVGNTTGFAEYVNLNHLGTVMHSDLADLQEKITNFYQKEINLRNLEDHTNLHAIIKF